VSEVYSDTPLAAAGLRAGDLILAVNQQPVEKLTAL
jgi:S1-C subfamily serine protease